MDWPTIVYLALGLGTGGVGGVGSIMIITNSQFNCNYLMELSFAKRKKICENSCPLMSVPVERWPIATPMLVPI